MSQKEKLIERLLSKPKDFTFDEVVTLLTYLGYEIKEGSGSRVSFICVGRRDIDLHRPHPRKELVPYQLDIIIQRLKEVHLL